MKVEATMPPENVVHAASDEFQKWSGAYGRTKRGTADFAVVAAHYFRTRKEIYRLQDACVEAFAQSRGWRIYKKQITVEQLIAGRMVNRNRGERADDLYSVIDHAEYFMCDRKPVAILSHSYAPFETCVEFARRYNLAVELLPFSWYLPGDSIAVLFTVATTPVLSPVTPPAAIAPTMTEKAGAFTYWQYRAAGWTEQQLRDHGYMT